MQELSIGIIGCGAIGKIHAEGFRRLGGVRIGACCDALPEAAEALLEAMGGRGLATSDPARLWADDSLDAVLIATHHDTHIPLALDALASGKAVLLEKPMALDLESALRLCRRAEELGGRVMMGFKLRFEPLVRKAHDFMPQPVLTVGQVLDNPWPEDAWVMDPATGGGNVLAQGCHMVDLVCSLNPTRPARVTAEGGSLQHPDIPLLDHVIAGICFENATAGSVIIGDSGVPPHASKFSLQMTGDGRGVSLSDRLKAIRFNEGGITPREEWVGEEVGFFEEDKAFVAALRNGEKLQPDHREGLLTVYLLDRMARAIESGIAQEIAPLDRLLARRVQIQAARPLRFGIVGGLNASHARVFTSLCNAPADADELPEGWDAFRPVVEHARVTEVWDLDGEQARYLAWHYGIETVANSPEEMRNAVDAVLLCDDRTNNHGARAEAFLRAGIPVFIDKPFAPDLASAEKLAAVVRETGTPCFSASALRFARELGELREAVGDPAHARLAAFTGPGDWVHYGIHVVEAAVALFGGEIESVQNLGRGNTNLVHLRYTSGLDVQIHVSPDYAPGFDCAIRTAEGAHHRRIADAHWFYRSLLDAVVEMAATAITAESREPPVPLEETLAIMRVLDAAERSKEGGGAVVAL